MSSLEKQPDEISSTRRASATAASFKVTSSSVKQRKKDILEHGLDADDALQAFAELDSEESLVLDAATQKRLLRRIDLFLMPIMCMVYMLNYLDKTTMSYASVMGLQKDINITSAQYSWLGSMFYFGYIAWEWPTNRLLQRLPLAKYSAFCVIMWGVTLACFAAVKDFSGAVAVRFFLGVFEATVTPGFALFTSQWYTMQEQGLRTAIWFGFNGWAQIFGGAVAYGLARGNDVHGFSIAAWKIVFLLTGLMTIVFGFVFLILMPDNQLNCWWLSKRDRVLAIERVRINQQGIGNRHFKLHQFKEALTDPMTWGFVFYALVADIPNGGVTNFFSLLIKSFGYTEEESLLLGIPSGAMEVISLALWGYCSQRWGFRVLQGAGWIFVALVGFILILAVPQDRPGGRLAGYYLYGASATGFVALLSLLSTNVAGYTKKTTVAALFLIAYCVGNIIGPQTFRKDNYVPAEITIIVCYGLCIMNLIWIHWYYSRQNKKKDAFRQSPDYVKVENQEWLDLTDRENPEFMYTL